MKEYVGKILSLDFADRYNTAVGAAVGILATLLGPRWYLFAALLALNALDWLSGTHAARRNKTESSAAGWPGLAKKVFYWVMVAVAFIIGGLASRLGAEVIGTELHFMLLLGWFTLGVLIINEARSICENLVEAGYNVPAVLTRGLAVAQRVLEAKGKAAAQEDRDTVTAEEIEAGAQREADNAGN